VEYASVRIEWYAIRGEGEVVVDLVPCSLPGDDDPYAYGMSDFPSLGKEAERVAHDIREAFKRRQLVLAREAYPEVNFDACDWVVARSVRRRIVEAGVAIRADNAAATAVVTWNGGRVETKVDLPTKDVPLSCAAFVEPPFAADDLAAYVAGCAESLAAPWRRRRDLTAEFRKVAAVVDVDLVDYAKVAFVVQILRHGTNNGSGNNTNAFAKNNNNNNDDDSSSPGEPSAAEKTPTAVRKRLHVITLSFGADFPSRPPRMSARDFKTGADVTFDRDLYKYSPRWEPPRLAKELIDHACASLAARHDSPRGHHQSNNNGGGGSNTPTTIL